MGLPKAASYRKAVTAPGLMGLGFGGPKKARVTRASSVSFDVNLCLKSKQTSVLHQIVRAFDSPEIS